jgi:hypothetical protein
MTYAAAFQLVYAKFQEESRGNSAGPKAAAPEPSLRAAVVRGAIQHVPSLCRSPAVQSDGPAGPEPQPCREPMGLFDTVAVDVQRGGGSARWPGSAVARGLGGAVIALNPRSGRRGICRRRPNQSNKEPEQNQQ